MQRVRLVSGHSAAPGIMSSGEGGGWSCDKPRAVSRWEPLGAPGYECRDSAANMVKIVAGGGDYG